MRGALKTDGFTLLEMLVAMTLMAVLAGALYASLHTAFAGRRAGERALEPVRRAAGALALLERDLRATAPPTGILAAEFLGVDQENDAGEASDRLVLHVLSQGRDGAEPPSPFRRVEIGLAADKQTGEAVLVRRTWANLLAPKEPEPAEEVLCRRVRSFDTRYYDGSGWTDAWDSTARDDALPRAVELSLTLNAEGIEEGYFIRRRLELPCAPAKVEEAGGGAAGAAGGRR